MTIASNGTLQREAQVEPAGLDAGRLTVSLVKEPKPLPPLEALGFGETTTDHMLIVHYDPTKGWLEPEIRPYGPIALDPMSSCFQYCPNVFEGMKACVDPNGQIRLFRPQKNMERLVKSAARVVLPGFNKDELMKLIKRLILLDKRWVPSKPGYSLYVRPTIIGTRAGFGVRPSDSACLYVVLSPSAPYFSGGTKPISLLAIDEAVRAWPGGTGQYKLGSNYSPGFLPQIGAAARGYDQVLWLFGEDKKITEVGAMNFFVVIQRDDGDVDLMTPPLDGTILPGVTRASVLELANAHTTGTYPLPGLPSAFKVHPQEKYITMPELAAWVSHSKVLECFCTGTAAIIAPISRIGFAGKDIDLPTHDGLGPITQALYDTIIGIQLGKVEFEDWSIVVSDI